MGDSHPCANLPQPPPAPNPATTIPATTIPAATTPATTNPPLSYAAAVHGGNPPVIGELSDRELKKTFFDGGPKKRLGQASVHQGRKTIRFSKEEIEMLAKPFRFALIGKFSHGYPTMQTLRSKLASFGLRGDFSIGVINLKHVLIRLTLEEDYTRLWLRQIVYIEGFPMRLFKWTTKFNPQEESPFAPVWVRFPNLPVQFFDKDALFCIAEMIGNPLRIDEATTDVTRPSVARVCVEIDLTKPLDDEIAVGFDSMLWIQKLNYERIPKYCSSCKHVGHNCDECRGKNSATNTAGPSRNVTTVNGKVDGAKHYSAANGQKRDQDPLAHTSDNASQENAHATSAAPRVEAPCPAAAAAHVANKDAAAAAAVPHAAHAPCPASAIGEMEAADSSIAAAAHVADKDAAAAAAVPHAAHASENVAHAPASPAVPHVPNKDAAAAAAFPHAARASDNVAHAPASPAVPHVANKDAAAAATVHAAVHALEAVPHAAEDASTSAAPRHPPAGHDQLHVSCPIAAAPRPATALPSLLQFVKMKKKIKRHKIVVNDESSKNEKNKEKEKKKGKKHKDVLIPPALLPDENESADAMR